MKNPRLQLYLFLFIIVGVSLWILLDPLLARRVDSSVATAVSTEAHPAAAPPTQATFAYWVEQGARLGAQPASLTGTAVDGALGVDEHGNLRVDLDLRRVFDYFLATLGEESLTQIRARIALYLQQHLPATAAAQAWGILNRYLHYKDLLASLPEHDGSEAGMRDSLQRQRELRDAQLGPELATAFFQADDQFADFALQHVDQLRDTTLTAEARQQRTEAMLNELPDDLREQVQASTATFLVEQQVNTLREQGASEDEIWQQRYEAYRQARAAIEASTMDAVDREQAILRLQTEQFTAAEQKRVAALDRIAGEVRTAP